MTTRMPQPPTVERETADDELRIELLCREIVLNLDRGILQGLCATLSKSINGGEFAFAEEELVEMVEVNARCLKLQESIECIKDQLDPGED